MFEVISKIILLFCLLLVISCSDSGPKVDSVEPTKVKQGSTTIFKIGGKNLQSDFTVLFDSEKCSDVTSSESEELLEASCLAPKSGDDTLLEVKKDDELIDNGDHKIELVAPYIKLDQTGADLSEDAISWDCIKDEVNNIIWSAYNDDSTKATYYRNKFQYSSNSASGNTTDCYNNLAGENCNSYNYLKHLNQVKLCGKDNWALPSLEQFKTLFSCTQTPVYNDKFVKYNQLNYWLDSSETDNKVDLALSGSCNAISVNKNKAFNILAQSKIN